MAKIIQLQMRRDTAALWASANPTPLDGEWCMETDTRLLKIGDGVTTYNALPYRPVISVATPINNQIGVWTGQSTLEGDPQLTWDGVQLGIDVAGTTDRLTENNMRFGGDAVIAAADNMHMFIDSDAAGGSAQFTWGTNTEFFTVVQDNLMALSDLGVLTIGDAGVLGGLNLQDGATISVGGNDLQLHNVGGVPTLESETGTTDDLTILNAQTSQNVRIQGRNSTNSANLTVARFGYQGGAASFAGLYFNSIVKMVTVADGIEVFDNITLNNGVINVDAAYITAYAADVGAGVDAFTFGTSLIADNTDNAGTVAGIGLGVRTTGKARWDILNVWQSTNLGDLVFRAKDSGSTSAEWFRMSSDTGLALFQADIESVGHIDVGTEILLTERSDHVFTPGAGIAGIWLRDDAVQSLVFTDDAGTDREIDTISPVVTGHIRAGNTQLIDGEAAHTALDVDSALIIDTWETVGPTGSGADNIWATMDQLPDNATILMVQVILDVDPNSAAAAVAAIWVTHGDDATPAQTVDSLKASIVIDPDADVGLYTFRYEVMIPLGATNQDFNLRYTVSGSSAESIQLAYRGFLTD